MPTPNKPVYSKGDLIRVRHNGKVVQGRVVRWDDGGGPTHRVHDGGYVVDIGEYASILVMPHQIVNSSLRARASALLRRMQHPKGSNFAANEQWKMQIYEAISGLMKKHEESASQAQKAFNDMIRAYSMHDHVSIKNPPVDDPDKWESVVAGIQQLGKDASKTLLRLLSQARQLS